MLYKNLIEFLRIRIAFYISMITLFGYLLYNSIGQSWVIITIASFFAGIAGYSHNNFFDYEEDKVNKRKTLKSKYLILVPYCFFFAGLLMIVNHHTHSIVFYSAPVILSWAYSSLRLKKILFLKNLYTSLGIVLIFLFGATFELLNKEVLVGACFVFFTILAAAICSDIRDLKGDKKAGVKTLPVVLGVEKTKVIIISLLSLALLTSLILFYPASFFILLMIILVIYNKFKTAHNVSGVMFLILNLLLILLNTLQ